MGLIIQIGIALGIVIAALGITDGTLTAIKERRKRKALEARRAHQILLAEKLGDPVALLITDRDLARDVYKRLEEELKSKDESPEELPEAEEPKKKKAQKRLPARRRT